MYIMLNRSLLSLNNAVLQYTHGQTKLKIKKKTCSIGGRMSNRCLNFIDFCQNRCYRVTNRSAEWDVSYAEQYSSDYANKSINMSFTLGIIIILTSNAILFNIPASQGRHIQVSNKKEKRNRCTISVHYFYL